MSGGHTIAVVGGGLFGLTGALELARRGHRVTVIETGSAPRPEAASTDLSKAIRLEYGTDELYTGLMERAIERWRAWNADWGETLFHQVGTLLLAHEPFAPGGFEYESKRVLEARGHRPEQLDPPALAARFPAWDPRRYAEAQFNPLGGWVESGRVIERLAALARRAGIDLIEGAGPAALIERGSRVVGATTRDGQEVAAEWTIVAAGAWTPSLLPELGPAMRAVAQPVFHLGVPVSRELAPPRFPPWAADIASTGWYGFPVTPSGVLKIASHGVGRRLSPDVSRALPPTEEARLRAFLAESLPGLKEAPLVGGRLCFYCDTWDGDFWIDHHPDRPGLFVAAGDSGHGFKFAPVIGAIIADALEGRRGREGERFRWRPPRDQRYEEARCQT